MAIRGDHPHQVAAQFPKDAVEDRTALLRAGGEGRVANELLEISRGNAHRLVELHGREAWELGLRESKQLELRATALERDALIPVVEMRTGEGGNSRAISESLRAGIVMAPALSTSAVTSVLTAMSRSVPEIRMPLSVVCTRRLANTGSVVLLGTAGVTAARPSPSFSRVMVKRIWRGSGCGWARGAAVTLY